VKPSVVMVTLPVTAWPLLSLTVTVQVPALTAVTVNTELGPFPLPGATVAIGVQVLLCVRTPV
jgi:hypothetical protein